jgi:hypothetical protein
LVWSFETINIAAATTQIKLSHLLHTHSRAFLAVAYLRESQEMVFDAHWRAFQLWGGVPRRGIYDKLKTAFDLISSPARSGGRTPASRRLSRMSRMVKTSRERALSR